MVFISDRRQVPVTEASTQSPASSASPPMAVTKSACRAAARALARSWSKPTSSQEVIVVPSQNTKRVMASSAVTSPSIEMAKAIRVASRVGSRRSARK